jgi:hypothetical protein
LSRYREEKTLPISKVQSMERDDIQVEKLSLSTHCPVYREEDMLPSSKVQSMERDDIQVAMLSLSTHSLGIERKIHCLLARCRVWRGMLSRWKSSR